MCVACGGSDLDPGAGDDPGTGTGTLNVSGTIEARPLISNARSTGDFETELSVQILRGQDRVTDGTVTVTSSSGMVVLAYRGDRERWEATAAGYDEVYVLDIESGTDNVLGVRVDGPDIHHFTAPSAGATVDSTMPLLVTWDSDQAADSTTLDADEIDRLAIEDVGQYTLPPSVLKAERDKSQENTLELRRANRVTPAGAAGGSDVEVRVDNRIQILAAPNPAL